MWYIVVLCIISIGIVLSCCNTKSKGKDSNEGNTINISQDSRINNPIDTIQPMYLKKDIEAKLKKLAESPKPEITSFGADCYAKTMPPDTASYVCPTCGNKTLYKINGGSYGTVLFIQNQLHDCRHQVSQVKGINIKLDESQFCKHCNKDIEEPMLCLLVNIGNSGDTTKVEGVNSMDIKLLVEFLNGELKHKDDYDFETPLVNHIDRIQTLLGVKLK